MNASRPSQTNDSQSDSSQAALTLEGREVLLVEDCMDQGRLYLNFLQIAGAEVTLECNGQSALHAVRKAPTRFDAVVMDFRMPKMHGLKATQQLREIGYSGVIVAMTAFGSEELRQSWFQAGCTEYLNKPLSKQELIHAVLRHTTVAMETVEG